MKDYKKEAKLSLNDKNIPKPTIDGVRFVDNKMNEYHVIELLSDFASQMVSQRDREWIEKIDERIKLLLGSESRCASDCANEFEQLKQSMRMKKMDCMTSHYGN